MLTGQNGILNRATEAKEKTDVAQKDEYEKIQGYEDIINQYVGNLPVREETKPYFPNNTFSYKEGDLSSGLVIKDADENEYVWVEVPTTIYKNSKYNTNGEPSSSTDYDKIEKCLKLYTSDYSDVSYSDTNTEFKTLYQNMLKSLYENGGFWIGRYEAGYEIDKSKGETVRDYGNDNYTEYPITQKVVIKENVYPYNWVRRNQAQELAAGINYGDCRGSLMFGIQWNLVLKYIETKFVEKNASSDIKAKLTSNSTTIGNYCNSEFTLNRGKFAQYGVLSDWKDYNSEDKTNLVTGCKKKEQSSYENGILLTTGATEAAKLQNIYDIAGNVLEWTLEKGSNEEYPCTGNGGYCSGNGLESPAKYRNCYNTYFSISHIGFRIGLWK